MTLPTVAPLLAVVPPQGITQYPVVLNYPVGSTIPEYVVAPGVQVYTIWLVRQGGPASAIALGFGSSQPFIPWDEGTFLDNGCQPLNEGVRLDQAGAQIADIVLVYWTFPGVLLGRAAP